MDYPKDNKQLDQIFINGSEPSIEEFMDEYWVKMLTGMIPNFRWAGHRKRFFVKNKNKIGNNIVLFNNTFGHFKVELGQCDDLNDLKVLILNYGNKKNFLTRSVRDKIRKIESESFLGRYYNFINGIYHFKGYFSLEKRYPRESL
jgi:hypothetical protein